MCMACLYFSCKKESVPEPDVPTTVTTGTLNPTALYSDSVFYVQDIGLIVKPVNTIAGTYTSTPDGLSINGNTGDIDINNSETGLKYKITFTPVSGTNVQTSFITVSGINYEDKIYHLSKGDSIAMPIYNANVKLALPGANTSSVFDQNGGCKKAGIAVNSGNAQINLALSVRNQGIDTGATQQVKLLYRINDGSNKSLNGINVKIYFYRTVSQIPQYLTDLIAARKSSIFDIGGQQTLSQPGALVLMSSATVDNKPVKARPPCIIAVGD